MKRDFDTKWSDPAWLTFERLPPDVQVAFLKQLPQLVSKYADLYRRKPAESVCVGTISHMQIPDWGMYLRMDTDYTEDEQGPVLFINELEEITKAELAASLAAAHRKTA